MSEKSILEKLQLKPGRTLLLHSAPEHYLNSAGVIPEGAAVTSELQPAFIIQVFVRTQSELESAFEEISPLVLPGGMLWITYPKLTSKLRGDLHRDTINTYAQKNGWTGIAIISIDEDWSGLRLKRL
ncbi:MAG TPA: hypothetical protein PKK59_07655 [Anaerolineaceae bacterium]|nr:hypothetical protein [Anaerolineaceae bacterium]